MALPGSGTLSFDEIGVELQGQVVLSLISPPQKLGVM